MDNIDKEFEELWNEITRPLTDAEKEEIKRNGYISNGHPLGWPYDDDSIPCDC